MLWNENRTSLFNTLLIFSRTLLLPNKENCRLDSYKYLQMKTDINNCSTKFIASIESNIHFYTLLNSSVEINIEINLVYTNYKTANKFLMN